MMLETWSAESSLDLMGLEGTTILAAAVMVGVVMVGGTEAANEVGVVLGGVAISTVFRIPPGNHEGKGDM